MPTAKGKFDSEKVASAIARTLRDDFNGLEIVDVHVAEDVDQYGDDIVRVEVVFEGDLEGDDIQSLVRARGRLARVLEEIDADLYPLLDFVSKAEYNRGRQKSARH